MLKDATPFKMDTIVSVGPLFFFLIALCHYPCKFLCVERKWVSLIAFCRLLNDWELEEVERFLLILHNKKVVPTMEDKIYFREAKGGLFSIKFVYQFLSEIEVHPFPSKIVWNSWVPCNVGFFAWEASWGRILTLDQIKRRGRALANRCFLCEDEVETVEHLLLHCSKAKVLWDFFLGIFGVQWVFPFLVRGSLLSWQGSFVGKKRKKAWMAAPLCLFWSIWRERNMIAFDDKCFSVNRLKTSFVFSLWSWSNVHIIENLDSLMDFLVWLGCK